MPDNSGDRLIFWTAFDWVMALTDAQLDQWKARGVDGFVAQFNWMYNNGGTNRFVGSAGAVGAGPEFTAQRRIRDTNITARMASKGMRLYIGPYFANYNAPNVIQDWFNDGHWSTLLLPEVQGMAGCAKLYGMAGVIIDFESYRWGDAAWNWNYPGNSRTEAVVKAKVKERGRQYMDALVAGYGTSPGIEVGFYHYRQIGWDNEKNQTNRPFDIWCQTQFIDGMCSNSQYGLIRQLEAIWYKSVEGGGAIGPDGQNSAWDNAMQWDGNFKYAYFSRNFSNWAYAAPRYYNCAFGWIDQSGPGELPYGAARPVPWVTTQFAAFRRQSGGRDTFNFCWAVPSAFNYDPYAPGLVTASTPGEVDATNPTVTITSQSNTATTLTVSGHAHDAPPIGHQGAASGVIRYVKWVNDRGGSGVIPLTMQEFSGTARYDNPWVIRMLFSNIQIPLQPGANLVTITAVDIHDREGTAVIPVGGAQPPPPPGGSSYLDQVNSDSPVSHWRFGDAAATTAADAKGVNNGTYQGAVTVGATSLLAGDSNTAANFAVSGSVNVPDSGSLDLTVPLSLEAWVRLDIVTGEQRMFEKTGAYLLQTSGTGLRFMLWTSGGTPNLVVETGLATATTYHVVATFDGSTMRLYKNGVEIGTLANSFSALATTSALTMGSSLDGVQDESAVYNTALSATRVLAHYNAGTQAASQTILPVAINTLEAFGTATVTPLIIGLVGDIQSGEAIGAPIVTRGTGVDYADEVAADTPTSHWTFGETSGTTATDGPGANDGTYTGTFALNQASLVVGGDPSVDLDGSTGCIVVPDAANLDGTAQLSLEVWIRPDAHPATNNYFNIAWKGPAANNPSYFLRYADDAGVRSLKFAVGTGGTDAIIIQGNVTLTLGQAYHVVGTYDGSNVRLYLNGALIAGPTAKTGTVTASSQALAWGRFPSDLAGHFNGGLDEAALYPTGLSAGRVTAHYVAGANVTPEGRTISGVGNIASAEVFGTSSVTPRLIGPSSIDPAEAIGFPTFHLGAVSPYAAIIAGDSPVSFWRLGEAGGTEASDQLGTNDGIYNAVALGQPGALSADANASGAFNGVGSFISRTAPSTLSGTWSFEAWTRVVELSSRRTIFGSRSPDDFGCQFSWGTNGVLEIVVGDGTTLFTTTLLPPAESPLDRWVHLVVARVPGSLKVYVDGALVSTTDPATASPLILFDATHHIAIGARGVGGGDFFAGRIDEVAAYNTELSAAQVLEHRNAALADQLILDAGGIASAEVFGSATLTGGAAAGLIGDLTLVVNDVSHGLVVSNVDHNLMVDEKQRGLLIDRNT